MSGVKETMMGGSLQSRVGNSSLHYYSRRRNGMGWVALRGEMLMRHRSEEDIQYNGPPPRTRVIAQLEERVTVMENAGPLVHASVVTYH